MFAKKLVKTQLPWDFLLDKQNLTNTELQLRLNCGGLKLFCKDLEFAEKASNDQLDVSSVDLLQEVQTRHKALRTLILDMARPRLSHKFVFRAKAFFKNEHQDFKTPEDYFHMIRTGEYNNDMRRKIDILSNKMWTKECIEAVEEEIMEKCMLEYVNKLVTGGKIKNTRKHGSIRSMINRLKQTHFVDKIRYVNKSVLQKGLIQRA